MAAKETLFVEIQKKSSVFCKLYVILYNLSFTEHTWGCSIHFLEELGEMRLR